MSTLKELLKDVPVELISLGNVVSISNTGVDKKVNADERPVRLLNFVDVFKNKYITNEIPKMTVTATDKKIVDCDVKKFDIFITPSSELIDEIGFSALAIEDLINTVYSYHIMRLRIIDLNQIVPSYLNYLFSSSDVRKQIRQKAQGITRYGLTQPNWKSIQIPIPYPNDPEKSLVIQQEIVRVLDGLSEQNKALTSALAQEIAQRKKQYAYYREELFRFEGKEVEWKTLGEIISKSYSGSTPRAGNVKYYQNGSIPWLRTQEVKFSEIFETEIKITETALKETGVKWIPSNCVIIAISGATAGRSAINKIPLTTNQHCLCLDINSDIAYYKYIFYWVSKNYEHLKSLGRGARGDLNTSIIKNLAVPVPSLQEQERIVRLLDQFDKATKSIVAQLEKEIELRNKQYEYYRNQLLSFDCLN